MPKLLRTYSFQAVIVFCTVTVIAGAQQPSAPAPPPLGISGPRAAKLLTLELRLQQIIRPENCRREHRIFTEKPHMAGSQRNYELAQYVAEQWRSYGLQDVR